MYKLKIFDVKKFKKELAELKENHIILFESDGYYRPSSPEEYDEFIEKQKENLNATKRIIEIALKEKEKLQWE